MKRKKPNIQQQQQQHEQQFPIQLQNQQQKQYLQTNFDSFNNPSAGIDSALFMTPQETRQFGNHLHPRPPAREHSRFQKFFSRHRLVKRSALDFILYPNRALKLIKPWRSARKLSPPGIQPQAFSRSSGGSTGAGAQPPIQPPDRPHAVIRKLQQQQRTRTLNPT